MGILDNDIISISPGVYRHVPTGFIVHEVWNVNQLEHANGVLAMGLTTGGISAYAWAVGEDLRSRIRMGGSSLSTLAAVMMAQYCLGETATTKTVDGLVSTDKQNTECIHLRMSHQGRPTNQMTYSEHRIFALINNCQAGSGVSHAFLVRGTYSTPTTTLLKDGYLGESYTKGVKVVYKTDPSHTGLLNNPTTANGVYAESNSLNWYHPRGLGVVYVRLPVMSWEQFLAALPGTVEHYDEPEVKSLVDAAIAKLRVFYPKRAPNLSLTIPLWLNTDGSVSLINPQRATKYRSSASYMYATRYPFAAGRVMGEGGMVSSPLFSLRGHSGSILYDNTPYLGNNPTDLSPWDSLAGGNPVRSIDGIRVERFLGGMGNLSDTGEQDRAQGAALTTAGLMGMLVGTTSWDVDKMPSRVVGGVTQSDEQYYGGLVDPTTSSIYQAELGGSSWRYNSSFGPEAALLLFDAAIKGERSKLTWATMSGIDPVLGMHLPGMTEWPTASGIYMPVGHDLGTPFNWAGYTAPTSDWDDFSTHQ